MGVPVGGIGSGSIGRGWCGDFGRWQLFPGNFSFLSFPFLHSLLKHFPSPFPLSFSFPFFSLLGFPNYNVVDCDQFSVFIGDDNQLHQKLRAQYSAGLLFVDIIIICCCCSCHNGCFMGTLKEGGLCFDTNYHKYKHNNNNHSLFTQLSNPLSSRYLLPSFLPSLLPPFPLSLFPSFPPSLSPSLLQPPLPPTGKKRNRKISSRRRGNFFNGNGRGRWRKSNSIIPRKTKTKQRIGSCMELGITRDTKFLPCCLSKGLDGL